MESVLEWWEELGASLSMWLLHFVTTLGFLFAGGLWEVCGEGLPPEQVIQAREEEINSPRKDRPQNCLSVIH